MQFGKCGIKNLLGEENMDNLILDKSKAFARRFDTMRTIFAEYNPNQNSIDVYTSAGFT